ncbi:GNAT family N-acetyltransferase [Sneathiella sp. P13V-1]|uniref:carbon-nitrogen hydrolase family protein n=1 Tax=Sneathiella sp. P13V-1 TaxID=2697366 RepID=UPI00187B9E2F|nr:bifunctional GNAT family N-acetyltransferase/carbon-nitrogen hydrolase family protein [Sneathiella sp. P13V-1]MBE7637130.1 GNAT family N-acetyltransferase [Sneathiella sp. P13V-1]
MKKASKLRESQPKLVVRNTTTDDIVQIRQLYKKVYPHLSNYTKAQIQAQIQRFPEGQFVVLFEEKVVGFCSTCRLPEKLALGKHSWESITGGGFASRHDPKGDWLYGIEIMVDPDMQGNRIGQRLYNERRKLCVSLALKGIVFGGRLPNLAKKWKIVGSAENYIEMVLNKSFRDPVLGFQVRNGFEPIGVLKDYFPGDQASMGYASHMIWHNHKYIDNSTHQADQQLLRASNNVRVSIVQYQQRKLSGFDEFAKQVEYFVDVVAAYKADFVLFPELFTLQLLSIENEEIPASMAIETLTRYTAPLKELLSRLAVSYNINIIGGSHPTKDENGNILNICYICLRDGSIHQQAKIHPTPNESYWWNIEGGHELQTIMTDCGPIGVLICYDSEFPELSRYLVDQGAEILFVPFCTDERQSYMRVRYCCQARAVENQCYVAMAGNVGNLPNVANMDIQYSQSSILTPCDFPFSRDGIAADTTPNVETVAFADLRMDNLREARHAGTVQNLKDRRFDLYSVSWKGES